MAQSTTGFTWLTRTAVAAVHWAAMMPVFAQSAPVSPDRPWPSPSYTSSPPHTSSSSYTSGERQLATDARRFQGPGFRVEPDKVYSLAELIDLAETHNPETRVAWENARAQAGALGIARSELFPALSAVALGGVDRSDAPLATRFYRQTVASFEVTLGSELYDFRFRRSPRPD